MHRITRYLMALALIAFWSASALAQDTAITYQGQLRDAGEPFTGNVNLEFRLFDQLLDGSEVAGAVTRLNWPVEDGLFQVSLDFGGAAFDGSDRFLEVRVNGAPLNPRQRVTATPYALRAASTADGAVGGSAVDPSQVQLRVTGNCPLGQAMQGIDENGGVVCETFWSATGNSVAGGDFLGTTNGESLEVRVANLPVMRIFDAEFGGSPTHAPNLVAGSQFNVLDESAGPLAGAAILSGGGFPTQNLCGVGRIEPCVNTVAASFATVVGGSGNYATGFSATAWGGRNTAIGNYSTAWGFETEASGGAATAMGNITRARGTASTAMGAFSQATGSSSLAAGDSAVASGFGSIAMGSSPKASGFAAIAMGRRSIAGGDFSWAAGREAVVRDAEATAEVDSNGECTSPFGQCGDESTFVWSDSSETPFRSTGPDQFLIRAAGGVGVNTHEPETQLHVLGPSPGADPFGQLRLEGDETTGAAGTGAGVSFLGHDGNIRRIWGYIENVKESSTVGNTRSRMSFYTRGPSFLPQEGLRIDSSGNVTTPNGSFSTASDRRLKEEIEPLSGSLGVLLGLHGVRFRYREETAPFADTEPRMGFVAQQVEQVLPEWVSENGDGYKQVTPTGFRALAVEAIRELRGEQHEAISRLEQENRQLRTQIAALQDRQETELADLRAELATVLELVAPRVAGENTE